MRGRPSRSQSDDAAAAEDGGSTTTTPSARYPRVIADDDASPFEVSAKQGGGRAHNARSATTCRVPRWLLPSRVSQSAGRAVGHAAAAALPYPPTQHLTPNTTHYTAPCWGNRRRRAPSATAAPPDPLPAGPRPSADTGVQAPQHLCRYSTRTKDSLLPFFPSIMLIHSLLLHYTRTHMHAPPPTTTNNTGGAAVLATARGLMAALLASPGVGGSGGRGAAFRRGFAITFPIYLPAFLLGAGADHALRQRGGKQRTFEHDLP